MVPDRSIRRPFLLEPLRSTASDRPRAAAPAPGRGRRRGREAAGTERGALDPSAAAALATAAVALGAALLDAGAATLACAAIRAVPRRVNARIGGPLPKPAVGNRAAGAAVPAGVPAAFLAALAPERAGHAGASVTAPRGSGTPLH